MRNSEDSKQLIIFTVHNYWNYILNEATQSPKLSYKFGPKVFMAIPKSHTDQGIPEL